MLIREKEANSIKEDKVTLVKNFTTLTKEYDANFVSRLIDENSLTVIEKTSLPNLKNVFQIKEVINCLSEFKIFFDFFRKLFKYEMDQRDEVDLFFSFVTQVGESHTDIEDVYIIGLNGKIIYRIYDEETKDYEINKGDLIFIPKGLKHKVIGLTPRVIASIGFYGKKNK